MADSEGEKPEADFSETDAVVMDENGNPRVQMEVLQKGGDGDIEGLVRKSDEE